MRYYRYFVNQFKADPYYTVVDLSQLICYPWNKYKIEGHMPTFQN